MLAAPFQPARERLGGGAHQKADKQKINASPIATSKIAESNMVPPDYAHAARVPPANAADEITIARDYVFRKPPFSARVKVLGEVPALIEHPSTSVS